MGVVGIDGAGIGAGGMGTGGIRASVNNGTALCAVQCCVYTGLWLVRVE